MSNNGDRLPPHDPVAEQCVLGCMMLDPVVCIPSCIEAFRGRGAESFYDLRHQTIFQTLLDMYDNRDLIDNVTLYTELRKRKALEECGGIVYVSTIPDVVPSTLNLPGYLQIVEEMFLLRSLVRIGTNCVSRAFDSKEGGTDVLDTTEKQLMTLRNGHGAQAMIPIKTLVQRAVAAIDDMQQRQGAISGLSTGFMDLDKLTTGMHPGEMMVIAARPSMGKTSLAMNIAEHVAMDIRAPVGVFSLEMKAQALVTRMLCSRSRVNLRNVREGFLAERDLPKLVGVSGKLANAPLYIEDTNGLSILQIRAKARRMAHSFGIQLFVIDYLQLVTNGNRRPDNRQQEVAEISGGVKSLAGELNVPVIVLSQLNRDIEREKGRRPRLADLRESGALEQDADFVGMLYKPPRKGQDDEDREQDRSAVAVNLLIAKQRNGPADIDVHLTFLKEYTRFESTAKIQSDDVPQHVQDTQVDMDYRATHSDP